MTQPLQDTSRIQAEFRDSLTASGLDQKDIDRVCQALFARNEPGNHLAACHSRIANQAIELTKLNRACHRRKHAIRVLREKIAEMQKAEGLKS